MGAESTEQHPALTYASYLALDEVLAAQRPRSEEHDEMLFIVIHQVYELWFKQLLHELDHLGIRLDAGDTPHSARTLRRALSILKVAVAQVDVLETMTPRQFQSFRDRLEAASGFQSAQFRELEVVLGRRDPQVLAHYPAASAERERIAARMAEPSLYDHLLAYLAVQGYDVPASVRQRDVTTSYEPSLGVQDALLQVYSDDAGPATVLEQFVDLDEGVQEWRYRHATMVARTIGDQQGTGGSPGAAYLRSTVGRPSFPDLWAVRSRL